MNGQLLWTGIIIGFAIAAPVGPVGVLCAQRTLAHGRLAGLVSGLGAAFADSLFGVVAAFGLSIVADVLLDLQVWVRAIGGAFLVVLGLRTFMRDAPPPARANGSPPAEKDYLGSFVSTFFLTLTNPLTILSFAGIFAAFGVVKSVLRAVDAWVLVAGVFSGSTLWWLIIAGGVGFARQWISIHGLRWVSRVSGTAIIAFGALALVTVAIGEHAPFG